MLNVDIFIDVQQPLISQLQVIATNVKYKQNTPQNQEILQAVRQIKTIMHYYDDLLVRFTQQEFQQNSDELFQIILKLHQIFMDLQLPPQSNPLNNIQEAHGLFHIIKNVSESQDSYSAQTVTRVQLLTGQSNCENGFITLDYELIKLATQARGEFNLYVNSVAQELMRNLGMQVNDIPNAKRLRDTSRNILSSIQASNMTPEKFEQYLTDFVYGDSKQINKSLNSLKSDQWHFTLSDDKQSLYLVEKLLIGLLGHKDSEIRDSAVKHLNSFYDDTDWQLLQPFVPKVKMVGDDFIITERVELNNTEFIYLQLHAPGFLDESRNYLVSYHNVMIQGVSKGYLLQANLGTFPRCGFYDWRFVTVQFGEMQPLMGNNSSTRVNPNQVITKFQTFPVQGRFIVHPAGCKDLQIHELYLDFENAVKELDKQADKPSFSSLIPTLQEKLNRGINCLYLMGILERYKKQNGEGSALSVIDRSLPYWKFGGKDGFRDLMRHANGIGMKIIVDSISRISSQQYSRKYKEHKIFVKDANGMPVTCYGTDGRSLRYDDSLMLNYRKVQTWNLLVNEILQLAREYGVNGVHLDNAHAWPQILELDIDEMYRKDPDGSYHYTKEEIFDGFMVKKNEKYGYWGSELQKLYPNPMFVKICKELWREFPQFLIIADVWNGSQLSGRDFIITKSGPIPRLYDLPVNLASVFGKYLHKSGEIDEKERKEVTVFKTLYEERKKNMPQDAILINSSTGHSLPYPALMYGRGAWAAVDLLFFLPDIPMTFIGEGYGYAYKTNVLNSAEYNLATKEKHLLNQQSAQISSVPRVGSTASLAIVPEVKELIERERKFAKDIGPEYGFDLTKIRMHYNHRRDLRRQKDVLRLGSYIPLVFRHEHGWHKRAIAFARYTKDEIAVIIINFNENPITGYLDLSQMEKQLEDEQAMIYSIGNWMEPESDQFYFKEELIGEHHEVSLLPFRSEILGIYPSDIPTERALRNTIERLRYKIANNKPIDASYGVIQMLKILQKDAPNESIGKLANSFGITYKYFLEPFSFSSLQFVKQIRKLNEIYAGRLLGYCDYIASLEGNSHPKSFATSLVQSNTLGPIIFSTPELGRWSTAGGLGVMVDELSQGLQELGEEVWVISPYYNVNKKGEQNYLNNDPANINWITNLEITIASRSYTIGVHQGYEHGINYLFLHNHELFPKIYPDMTQAQTMIQLVAWAKGTLETLCYLQKIPAIMVTNDWFTGLIAAYAKLGSFGDVFKGTIFVHIVHNLDPSYEGRLYPNKNEGKFEDIHQLPPELFINPYWQRLVINPSRCAIQMSDQWATVSPSYRNELLGSSPLKEILKTKSCPFAYPNGIPIQQRLERLRDKGSHYDAKRTLQQKYFNHADLNDAVPLFAFVGRITEQKGVHLILDAAELLIPETNYQIQFLVGGPFNPSDKYSISCANRMRQLRERYPTCFFADPDNFFYDGPLTNLGADFGLMPSMFEPGGIVQHEFFVANTPVIAFQTGGLRDTVIEYNWDNQSGCGFVFQIYDFNDFKNAVWRAIHTFRDKFHYNKLREEAFKATVDGKNVSRAWNQEFYRLANKIYFETNERQRYNQLLKNCGWQLQHYSEILPKNRAKRPMMLRSPSGNYIGEAAQNSKQGQVQSFKRHVQFRYQTGFKVEHVQLVGTFDNWQIRHPLTYDYQSNSWHITLQLKPGRYLYKYVVDGLHWVYSHDHPSESDGAGNTNNVIEIS